VEENKPELGGDDKPPENTVRLPVKKQMEKYMGKDGFRKTKHLTRKQIEKHYRVLQANFNNLSQQANKQNAVLTAYIKLSTMALGELYMTDPKNHMFAEKGGIGKKMLEDAKSYKRVVEKEKSKSEEKKPDIPLQDKAVQPPV